MAIKRVMGSETEYGIIGEASRVLGNYNGGRKKHENKSETNRSAIRGMVDRGHFGGDYDGEVDLGIASSLGLKPSFQGFSSYFGRDDMLANGARFYIDMGHPEYSTPEASNPLNAVLVDKAGERVLEIASGSGKVARIFKNNTDGTSAYGCHENYLVDRQKASRFKELAKHLMPFFVSRIVFVGSGKIGFRDGEKSRELQQKMRGILDDYGSLRKIVRQDLSDLYARVRDGLEEVIGRLSENEFLFHISQRADFFEQLIGLETTCNRPIVNTRDEPLSDRNKYMRLHVICGDANLCEVADYLKFGTMGLVLDLFEDGKLTPMRLKESVEAFHAISRDPTLQTRVRVKKQGEMTAIEIQRQYQEAAEAAYRGRDSMTDDVLDRWKTVLDGLEENPMQLSRWLDWVAKKNLIDAYITRTGKKMSDKTIRNIDLQYHEVNREKGLFYILQRRELIDRLLRDEDIERAVTNPPEDTRAWIRGELIRRYNVSNSDWDEVSLKGQDIVLKDPLRGTREELGNLFDQNGNVEQLVAGLRERGYVEEKPKYKPIEVKVPKKTIVSKPFSSGFVEPSPFQIKPKFAGGKNGTRPKKISE